MAELLEAEGLARRPTATAADLVVLNTCHIREKAAEKVYSDIGRLKRERRLAADDRGRRLRRPGRGRRDPAPRAGRRHRRRPAGLSPICPSWSAARRSGERGARHRHAAAVQVRRAAGAGGGRRRAPSSPSRKAATNSAPIASCPIRAAPRSRGPARRSLDEAKALVDAGAKEITLLGQNVNAWRGRADGRRASTRLIRALDRAARPRAHPLHDQPSRRHDRGADPRPCRGREADALSSICRCSRAATGC